MILKWSILIFSTHLVSLPVSVSYVFGRKCSKICGITSDIPSDIPFEERDDVTDRIVNGHAVKNRPWMVVIIVGGQSLCGGVLINKWFVFSAGHCFCTDDPSAKCKTREKNGVETSVPDYDVTSMVKIHVGVNNKDLSFARRNKKLTHHPSKVWFKEGWVMLVTMSSDVAMAKLTKPVKFAPPRIAPVCLPTKKISEKAIAEKKNVYVAGWGLQNSQCDTNDSGPSPNAMCKFPFNYQGKTYHSCVHERTPADTDPMCKALFHFLSKNRNVKVKQTDKNGAIIPVKVLYGRRKSKYCFNTNQNQGKQNQAGWCGTCYRGVENSDQQGQEGYCNPFIPDRTSLPTETANPTTSKNWGMCADWCAANQTKGTSKKLLETSMDLLDISMCKKLIKRLEFDERSEICVGNIKRSPVIEVLRRKRCGHRWSKNCFRRVKKEVYNYGVKSPHGFHIGGTDSCKGDSGGPLVTFLSRKGKTRAYTLGAVSRGAGCANFNKPGILSSVSYHRAWIKKIAKKGTC